MTEIAVNVDMDVCDALPAGQSFSLVLRQYSISSVPCGVAVIFYNQHNDGLKGPPSIPPDVETLRGALRGLGFQEPILHRNFTAHEMELKMKFYAKSCNQQGADAKPIDCFFAAFLNDRGGCSIKTGAAEHLAATNVYKLAQDFKGRSCPRLAGKPKIFLVQARQLDHASDFAVAQGASGESYQVAAEADVMYVFAVTPSVDGCGLSNKPSFIASLSGTLKTNPDNDFARALLLAGRESNSEMTIESSLTKLLFFGSHN